MGIRQGYNLTIRLTIIDAELAGGDSGGVGGRAGSRPRHKRWPTHWLQEHCLSRCRLMQAHAAFGNSLACFTNSLHMHARMHARLPARTSLLAPAYCGIDACRKK